MDKALSGIKVLDMTNFEAGPTCTEDLAFLGADVYRIDRVKKDNSPRAASLANDIVFSAMNMSKKSLSVDLKSSEGKNLIWKMIDACDVLVENMSPGAMERLGFSWEAVHARNPRIIYVSIKGFGKGSPWESYPAFDPCAQAVGGAVYFNGPEGGEPMLVGPDIADYSVGHLTAIGIIAALFQREKTGRGQFVEGAMQDVMACCLRGSYEPWYNTNGHYRRCGNGMRLENVAPHNIYKCKGGGESDYLLIYCSRVPTSTNFQDLMTLIGREEFIADPRMADAYSRYTHRKILDEAITEWTLQHDKYEAMDLVASAGIPCGAILDLGEVIENPFLRSRGTIVDINTEISGVRGLPAFPIKLSDSAQDVFDPPRVGQHTNEILKEVVGMTSEEIEFLKDKKIVFAE